MNTSDQPQFDEKNSQSPSSIGEGLLNNFRGLHPLTTFSAEAYAEQWGTFVDDVILEGVNQVGLREAKVKCEELHLVLKQLQDITDSANIPANALEALTRIITDMNEMEPRLREFIEDIHAHAFSVLGDPIAAFTLSFIAHDLPKIARYIEQICGAVFRAIQASNIGDIHHATATGLDLLGPHADSQSEHALAHLLDLDGVNSEKLRKRYDRLSVTGRANGTPSNLTSILQSRFGRIIASHTLFQDHPVTLSVTSSVSPKEHSIPAIGVTVEVLAELIGNALKVMALTKSGTNVTVDVGSSDTHLIVRVIDDGPGVPADTEAESLFTGKVGTTTQQLGGSGNGLRLTRGGVHTFWPEGSLLAEKNEKVHQEFPSSTLPRTGMTFLLKIPRTK